SETMIWQPEFTDKTLSRKTGAVHSRLSTTCTRLRLNPARVLFINPAATFWA
ncbi:replication protein P, partial [Escherichia coli]|nr:replication protein P [Escherichia coli]